MTQRTWLAIPVFFACSACGEEPRDLADIHRDYCAILMNCNPSFTAVGYDNQEECEEHRAKLYQDASEDKNPACMEAQTAFETCVGELEGCDGFEDYWSGPACEAETDAWWWECFGVTV